MHDRDLKCLLSKNIRSSGLIFTLSGLGLLVLLVLSFSLPFNRGLFSKLFPKPPSHASSNFMFGTLVTDPNHVVNEYRSGVRVAMIELNWGAYETADGSFDPNYISSVKNQVSILRDSGMNVVLSTGLQYPPVWLVNYPNSSYVNQFKQQYNASYQTANLIFSQTARTKAEAYLAEINKDFGLNNFWAIRINGGGFAETLYPPEDYNGRSNQYWAFDANAQAAGTDPDRPSTIPANPFPGWIPGQRTYNGQPFTVAQVSQWYDWYLGSLVDSLKWQINFYQNTGFKGFYQILTPGLGMYPSIYDNIISNYLDGTQDLWKTMGRGSIWFKVLPMLKGMPRIVVYDSALGEQSNQTDRCQPSDDSVDLTTGESIYSQWSAARWISYLADLDGFLKNGENPGRQDAGSSYNLAMMQAAAAQMASCNYQGMIWAHDSELFNKTDPAVSLSDYANTIAQYNGTPPPITRYQVYCGSNTYPGSQNSDWESDGTYTATGSATFSTTNSISNTPDPTIYQSARYGNNFIEAFPISNGNYNVTLKFAEIYWTRPGQRVFNVSINGTPALENFDVLSHALPNTALDETFPVTVVNGEIKIMFTKIIDDAMVSAIEIIPTRLQGDVNGDGIIDLGDFSALSIDYGKPLSQAEFPGDDVDQDNSGVVDLGDVSKFIIIYQGIYGI